MEYIKTALSRAVFKFLIFNFRTKTRREEIEN